MKLYNHLVVFSSLFRVKLQLKLQLFVEKNLAGSPMYGQMKSAHSKKEDCSENIRKQSSEFYQKRGTNHGFNRQRDGNHSGSAHTGAFLC